MTGILFCKKKHTFFRFELVKNGISVILMTCQATQGAVAQLARAIRSHRIGREFESLLLHHSFHKILNDSLLKRDTFSKDFRKNREILFENR